jgi:hypothetical protein
VAPGVARQRDGSGVVQFDRGRVGFGLHRWVRFRHRIGFAPGGGVEQWASIGARLQRRTRPVVAIVPVVVCFEPEAVLEIAVAARRCGQRSQDCDDADG